MPTLHEPLFIIGFDRSGTTLLSSILDSHEEVAIPYESHFIPKYAAAAQNYDFTDVDSKRRLVEDIFKERFPAAWDYRPEIGADDLAPCRNLADVIDVIFSAYAEHKGKRRWGDKTPGYTGQIDVIHSLFPAAKFVHILRDGRDVALSLMRQSWGPASFLGCLAEWRETVYWARKMGRLLPRDRYLELRYEDLLEQPEPELQRIVDFLGLDYSPRMLSDYAPRAMGRVPRATHVAHAKLSQGLDRANAYKWKKRLGGTDQHLAYILGGPLLEDLGYPRGNRSSHWVSRQVRKAYWSLVEFHSWRTK